MWARLRHVSNTIKNTSANAMKTMVARHAVVTRAMEMRGMRERSGKKKSGCASEELKKMQSVMW